MAKYKVFTLIMSCSRQYDPALPDKLSFAAILI